MWYKYAIFFEEGRDIFMKKSWKQVFNDIKYDTQKCLEGNLWYAHKKPHSAVLKFFKKGERINFYRSIDSDYMHFFVEVTHIPCGIGYGALAVYNYFTKNAAAIAKAEEETAPQVKEYIAGVKPSIIEKYPQIADRIADVEGRDLLSSLRDIYKECHSVVSDKQVVVKDDWGDYFVDVRNGLITNMENSVDDIVHSAVHAPTLTDILVVPEAIAAVGVICSLPALYYYGVPALGKLAISVDIAGQHIKENLHSSKTV